MIRSWIRSLSHAGALLGTLVIGVSVVATVVLAVSAADLVGEVMLLAVLGGGLLTAVTGVAVYGYVWTNGD